MNQDKNFDASGVSQSTAMRLDQIVYQLQEIHVSLEHLRVSLNSLSNVSQDHETRLRRSEAWRHRVNPLLAAVTFAVGAALSSWVSVLVK